MAGIMIIHTDIDATKYAVYTDSNIVQGLKRDRLHDRYDMQMCMPGFVAMPQTEQITQQNHAKASI